MKCSVVLFHVIMLLIEHRLGSRWISFNQVFTKTVFDQQTEFFI